MTSPPPDSATSPDRSVNMLPPMIPVPRLPETLADLDSDESTACHTRATCTMIGHANNVPNPSAMLSSPTSSYDPSPRYHQIYFHPPSIYRRVHDQISATSKILPPNAFSTPTTATLCYSFADLSHPSPMTPSAYMPPFSFTRG